MVSAVLLAGSGLGVWPARAAAATNRSPLIFINTSMENASPLSWAYAEDGTVIVSLVYDQERGSPNRAAGHWLFQVEAPQGSVVSLVLTNFDNVWNGRFGSPISTQSHCYVSADSRHWNIQPAEKRSNNTLRLNLKMDQDHLLVARLEPYRLSDLERFKSELRGHSSARIEVIGKTVEGRDLEIIRLGEKAAPHRVFLRARAHAWEPVGNWVVQGLARRLLQDDAWAKSCRQHFCVYVLPMANKDSVARGRTRFNSAGMDLNRLWDKPADPQLAPENAALEQWLNKLIHAGQKPDLALDLHNDNNGQLHISRPDPTPESYLANMRRLEALLRQHTFFTVGSTAPSTRNPGTIGEGLLERYGIDAAVLEFNCDWIAKLAKPPTGRHWEEFGENLLHVFDDYFATATKSH